MAQGDDHEARAARADAAAGRRHLADLIPRVAAGDKSAFEDLYRFTSAKLFGICLRILPVRQEAEEVLQEIYIAVWQRAGSFDSTRGTAMTWLITLARNRSIDRLRVRVGRDRAPLDAANDVIDPRPLASDLLEASSEERRAVAEIDGLDTIDAAFIRSAFLEGTSYPDIARREGLPLGTVKSRIRRALLKMRTRME